MRHHSRLVVLCAAAAAFVLLGSTCKLTNKAPSVPTISGPTTGVAGVPVTFKATSTDPDGDSLTFLLDWGDGATPAWTALVASGDTVTATNTYADSGTFTIKARAKDKNGKESDWSAGQSLSLIEAAPAYPDSVVGEISIPWESFRSGMSPDGSLICVGPSDSPDTLLVIRTLDRVIAQQIQAGAEIGAATFTSDNRLLFVSSYASRSTLCIDLSQGRVVRSATTSHAPYALVLSPDDALLYIGLSQDRKILSMTADSLVVQDSVMFDYNVRGMTRNAAGTALYVCTSGGVGLVNVPSCSLAVFNTSVTLATKPVLSNDEQVLYVTSGTDSGIAVLRASDLSVVRRVNLHSEALGEMSLSPDGAHLYVDMPVGIYTLDTRTMAPVDSVALGEMWGIIMPHPNGDSLYYAGGRKVWVIGKRQ